VSRLVTAVLVAATASVAASQSQQAPSVLQNGRVETRTGQSIDREITALASPDPVWLVWRVPMVAGDRELCSSSFYSDRNLYSRGYMLEWAPPGTGAAMGMPQVTPPKGPVQIEAGTSLLVLVRTLDGSVERMRTLADDCPIDAGGRTVNWLSALTASLRTTGFGLVRASCSSAGMLSLAGRRDSPDTPRRRTLSSVSASTSFVTSPMTAGPPRWANQ